LIDLLGLIEANHFSIAVVGEFKRGKSTFINALLGDEILPADIEPCSATLNRVTYGLKPSATVVFRAEAPEQTERIEHIPIERLSDYVTKLTPESETMSTLVKEAVITYPVPFCKNNVDIIDTPGLNDDPVMTEVTFAVLSTVHAAIMVVMANAPFGESESIFLREVLLKEHTSVLFVITAIDRIKREADRERVIRAIRTRITQTIENYAAEQFGQATPAYASYLQRMGAPMIFGLSGYEALEARREHDAQRLIASGFPEFEMALEQFLTRNRGARTMVDSIERAIVSARKLSKHIDSRIMEQKAERAKAATDVRAMIDRYTALRVRTEAALGRALEPARQEALYRGCINKSFTSASRSIFSALIE
jgi:predicted GTPase